MNAYEIAEEWQKKYGEGTLQERIEWHKNFGLVYITPTLFFIANEVYYDYEEKFLYMNVTNTNSWFIELATNTDHNMSFKEKMKKMMQILPSKKDFVLWYRRESYLLHCYKWDNVARKVGF
jgi:hypothetical protein